MCIVFLLIPNGYFTQKKDVSDRVNRKLHIDNIHSIAFLNLFKLNA